MAGLAGQVFGSKPVLAVTWSWSWMSLAGSGPVSSWSIQSWFTHNTSSQFTVRTCTRAHTHAHILICLGVLLFLNEILPCSSAWPQILYPPTSTSQVQGWQACHHQDVSNQYFWHQLAPVLAKQYDQKFDVGGGQKFLALGFTLNSFFYVEMFNSKKCFHRHMFSMCLGNGHITEKINFMKMFQ